MLFAGIRSLGGDYVNITIEFNGDDVNNLHTLQGVCKYDSKKISVPNTALIVVVAMQ